MLIEYKNHSIQKICTNASSATEKYGPEMAEKIHLRIDQIKASDNVEQMILFHIGRCHGLQGKRKNQYAMDLVHPQRLIFEKIGSKIQIAKIIEITDYHDKERG